jgi:uncharacterized protein (TIGR02266 family)
MANAAEFRPLTYDSGVNRTISSISAKAAPWGSSALSEEADPADFETLRERLLAREAVRPFADPRQVARAALCLAERMAEPETRRALSVLGDAGIYDPSRAPADDLRMAARALLFILSKVEGTITPAPTPPSALVDDAREMRDAMVKVVDRELTESDDARLWLDVVRTSGETSDLAADLRCLANLYRVHASLLPAATDSAVQAERALALADAIDGGGSRGEWSAWLARAWALLAPLYEEAGRAIRFVLRSEPEKASFPSLPTMERMRRSKRPSAPGASGWPGAKVSVPAPPPLPVFLKPPPLPLSVAKPPPLPVSLPRVNAEPILVAELEEKVDVARPVSEPCPAPEGIHTPHPRHDSSQSVPVRGARRHEVEVEVDLVGDSNFYLGFTENLSKGGLFVATYVLRPIGSILDLSVRLAGHDEPLRLRGEVRWIREPSATSEGTSDLWPGMGVRFQALSAEDTRRILDFLQARAPLFFDE